EAMRRNDDGTWTTSYDSGITGKLRVNEAGDQHWTNGDNSVTKFADGSVEIKLGTRPSIRISADGTETVYSHSSDGPIVAARVKSNGATDLTYRRGFGGPTYGDGKLLGRRQIP